MNISTQTCVQGSWRCTKAFRIFFLFGLSGVIGFLVDTAVLHMLKDVFGVYYGRILSFFCAVFVTWLINRNATFRDRQSGLSKPNEFSRYVALMLGGGLVNYIVYAILVNRVEIVKDYLVIGVAAGSLAGMTVNLISSRFLLYRNFSEQRF